MTHRCGIEFGYAGFSDCTACRDCRDADGGVRGVTVGKVNSSTRSTGVVIWGNMLLPIGNGVELFGRGLRRHHGIRQSITGLVIQRDFGKSVVSVTNHERVASALSLLTEGMSPFVEGRLRAVHNGRWQQAAQASFRDDRARATPDGQGIAWDAHALLTVMWDQWNSCFRNDLGHTERSLVSELREFRNRWAHQQSFDFDDTYRILDSVRRLLGAARSPQLAEIQQQKQDLLESHVAEQVNTQLHKAAFQRNKWWVIAIYMICCVTLVGFLIAYGNHGTPAAITVLSLVFVYLCYQQFKLDPPLLYGPRECGRCHRIIYRKNCPYCDG